ncbi:hypothetical protein [Collimonas humicola]|uniref:hypothetical protein n=1 Tax=Collimonas humicola TaxID=2825886 RepID=UPI001B8C066B|nr:hypothetical protein [Collimonas humicola]
MNSARNFPLAISENSALPFASLSPQIISAPNRAGELAGMPGLLTRINGICRTPGSAAIKNAGQCCHKIIDKATSNSTHNALAKAARRQFLLLADHF